MTKDVIVTISGLHATDGESEEPVEIIVPGQYYLKNGKHYVLFEEVLEGLEGKMKSTIKFAAEKMELIRTGAASVRMVFEKEQEHPMVYQTPMGPLFLTICTRDIRTEIDEAWMSVCVDYLLKAEDQIITDSTVRLKICEKNRQIFSNQE